MRIQSPLSNLCEVLRQINDSAAQYQATLKKNEAATRAVLIDPVLRALGWDIANTNMVEVEKTLTQTRVDYALYDNNGDVNIIIEAKSLSENLNQPSIIMSLVTYAFTFKFQDIFLTNGLIWQHFTNFQPGNVIATKILDITNDNPVECAAYLVQRLDVAKFWPNQQNIDVLAQRIDQLESLVTTLRHEISTLKPVEMQATLTATTSQSDAQIDYVDLDSLGDTKDKKPVRLRLPDGTTLPIKKWKDILVECCKFSLSHNPAITIPFPDRVGRKVALFSVTKPPTGISYVTETYKGQTIFVYTNYPQC